MQKHQSGDVSPGITPRERELLSLLYEGLSNRQMAERLHLSIGTIRNAMSTLLGKLGAANRVQALMAFQQLQRKGHRPLLPPRMTLMDSADRNDPGGICRVLPQLRLPPPGLASSVARASGLPTSWPGRDRGSGRHPDCSERAGSGHPSGALMSRPGAVACREGRDPRLGCRDVDPPETMTACWSPARRALGSAWTAPFRAIPSVTSQGRFMRGTGPLSPGGKRARVVRLRAELHPHPNGYGMMTSITNALNQPCVTLCNMPKAWRQEQEAWRGAQTMPRG